MSTTRREQLERLERLQARAYRIAEFRAVIAGIREEVMKGDYDQDDVEERLNILEAQVDKEGALQI